MNRDSVIVRNFAGAGKTESQMAKLEWLMQQIQKPVQPRDYNLNAKPLSLAIAFIISTM